MKAIKSKVLYWPGIGQDIQVMHDMLNILRKRKFDIIYPEFVYDKDEFLLDKKSEIYKWVEKQNAEWWIGLSLGASLAYTIASLLPIELRPARITLINPFSSRVQLSKEKGFSLENQWIIEPKRYNLSVREADIVISLYDEKIPIYHGIELASNIMSRNKKIIFLKANHMVMQKGVQEELGGILLSMQKDVSNEKSYYCNIYKQ